MVAVWVPAIAQDREVLAAPVALVDHMAMVKVAASVAKTAAMAASMKMTMDLLAELGRGLPHAPSEKQAAICTQVEAEEDLIKLRIVLAVLAVAASADLKRAAAMLRLILAAAAEEEAVRPMSAGMADLESSSSGMRGKHG